YNLDAATPELAPLIPPRTDGSVSDFINLNTQVNVFPGGVLQQGTIFGDDPESSDDDVVYPIRIGPTGIDAPEINLLGGRIGPGITAIAGTLNLRDGSVDASFVANLRFDVNMYGGTLEETIDDQGNRQGVTFGGNTTFYGGIIPPSIEIGASAKVEIVGTRFRLDGEPVESREDSRLPLSGVLTGILEDGTPFVLSRQNSTLLAEDWTFTESSVASGGKRKLSLSKTGNVVLGIRPKQSVSLRRKASVADNAVILAGSLSMRGGTVGDNVSAIDARVKIDGGNVGEGFSAFEGTRVDVDGGKVEELTLSEDSVARLTGGRVEKLTVTDGTVVLKGGKLGDSTIVDRGRLTIKNGTVGDKNTVGESLRSGRGTMIIRKGKIYGDVVLGGSGSLISGGKFRGNVTTGSAKSISGGDFTGTFSPGDRSRLNAGTFRGGVTVTHDESGALGVNFNNGDFRNTTLISGNGRGIINGGKFRELMLEDSSTLRAVGGGFLSKAKITENAIADILGGKYTKGIEISGESDVTFDKFTAVTGFDITNGANIRRGVEVLDNSTASFDDGRIRGGVDIRGTSTASFDGARLSGGVKVRGDAPTGDEVGVDRDEFAKLNILSGNVGNVDVSGKAIAQHRGGNANFTSLGEGSVLQLVGTSFSLDGRDLADEILSVNDFSLASVAEIDDLSTFQGVLRGRLSDGTKISLNLKKIDIDPTATITLYLPASRDANSIGLDPIDLPFEVLDDAVGGSVALSTVAVPEPGTALLALAAGGVALTRRRRA
ncbi:MAG: PEP-CTERM sorting domain-containing protein, partial [Planctomycetota bacterium]